MNKKALLVTAFLMAATTTNADDVWVLQGFAFGQLTPALFYLWTGDVLLLNPNPTPATIRIIDISNGTLRATNREFVISPGRSTSVNREAGWSPTANEPLWVDHLDVPAGVVVESRISVGQALSTGGPSMGGVFGKVSFPAFRALQPAGVTKIHLGTDLEGIPSRNNVAVYNSADVAAHAHIEVHQVCDESRIDSRDLDIPGKTVVQVTGLSTHTTGCLNIGTNYTYVAVTVDQPSLSWVSSLSNADPIKIVWGITSSSP